MTTLRYAKISCNVMVTGAKRCRQQRLKEVAIHYKGILVFNYTYPLKNPMQIYHTLEEGTTFLDILKLAAVDYQKIYDEENAAIDAKLMESLDAMKAKAYTKFCESKNLVPTEQGELFFDGGYMTAMIETRSLDDAVYPHLWKGPHGIYGHGIGDLVFEAVEIKGRDIHFAIGS